MQTIQEINARLATAYVEYKKDPVGLRDEFMIFYRWCMQMAFAAIDEYLGRHSYEKRED